MSIICGSILLFLGIVFLALFAIVLVLAILAPVEIAHKIRFIIIESVIIVAGVIMTCFGAILISLSL